MAASISCLSCPGRAGARQAIACRASATAVGEADPKPLPKAVVEVGSGGQRRRTLELHSSSSNGTAVPPLAAPAAAAAPSSAPAAAVDGTGPMASLRSFFLPRGWPHSVTPDYLNYQLNTVPAHVTGWMSHSLATSSMIQALGVGANPVAAVATSAAIKWITKDGLGAAGRLIVGGKLASVFDEDPRRWRMVAEGVTTLGLALEIATRVYPAYFVALAGAGTLAKSMAKGMGRPCFRVIQTHFSATNNVGDVAAKEEVWEVAAQMAGLASSVLLLQLLEAAGRPELAVPAWAAVQGVHVVYRYQALKALRFPYPNQKRAALLVSSHISSGRVPSIEDANLAEQILLPPSACRPHVVYGCTLDEAVGGSSGGDSGSSGSGGGDSSRLQELLQLYSGEQYVLTWHSGTAWVLLLEGAQASDMLRAMWQAAWLESRLQSDKLQHQQSAEPERLAESLASLRQQWADFEAQARQQGWQLEKAVLPQGSTRLLIE